MLTLESSLQMLIMDILAGIKCGSKPLSNSILDVPGLDEDRRELSILGTGTTTYFPADFILINVPVTNR